MRRTLCRGMANPEKKNVEPRRISRRAGFTLLSSIASRLLSAGLSFIAAPLLVTLLGREHYGYWITIVSTVAMLSFSDFGIGSGLINIVATSLARAEVQAIRRAISSAFFLLGGIGLLLGAIALLCYFVVQWQKIFLVADQGAADGYSRALLILSLFSFIALPFSIVQRVQFANHEGYFVQMWQGAGALMTLCALMLSVRMKVGMSILAISIGGPPMLSVVMNWGDFFLRRRPDWLPRLSDWNIREAAGLLSSGSFFLVLQLGSILVFSIDNLILMHFFGPDTVTQYSLVAKLFQIPNMLASMWFAALWPSYAHALARSDVAWIKWNLVVTTVLATLATLIAVCLLSYFISPVVFAWTGVHVAPSLSLLIALSLSAMLVVGTSSISIYLSASRVLSGQAMLVFMYAMVSLPLAALLPRVLGPSGVAWSIAIGYLVTIVPGYCLAVPRLLRQQSAQAM